MRFAISILLSPLMVLTAIAGASPAPVPQDPTAAQTYAQALQKVLEGARPKTTTCDMAATPHCITAQQIAAPLVACMSYYQIKDAYEQAVVISMMTYESVDLKYNAPAGKPVAGKGTRNLQSAQFNTLYAKFVWGDTKGAIADYVATTDDVKGTPDDVSIHNLMLVNDTISSTCSASWFMATQCQEDIRAQVRSGSIEAFHAYLKTCVGTGLQPERDTNYNGLLKYVESKTLPILLPDSV